MGQQSSQAAARAVRDGLVRPGVSRAYYALYSHIAGRFVTQGMTRFGQFGNPPHRDVPDLVRQNLAGLDKAQRRELAQAVRRLYTRRLAADYRPQDGVEANVGRGALRDLAIGERILGVGQ